MYWSVYLEKRTHSFLWIMVINQVVARYWYEGVFICFVTFPTALPDEGTAGEPDSSTDTGERDLKRCCQLCHQPDGDQVIFFYPFDLPFSFSLLAISLSVQNQQSWICAFVYRCYVIVFLIVRCMCVSQAICWAQQPSFWVCRPHEGAKWER